MCFSQFTERSVTCLLHLGHVCTDEKVHKWTDATWSTVQSAVEKRKQTKTSKYHCIIQTLPGTPGERDGYHSSCYRRFTTVPKLVQEKEAKATRSTCGAVLPKHNISKMPCIFFSKVHKSYRGTEEKLGSCETKEAEESIRSAALRINDSHLMRALDFDVGDFVAKEIKYHHSCRREYLNKARGSALNASECSELSPFQLKESIFSTLCKHIEVLMLNKKEPQTVASLLNQFRTMYIDQGGYPLTLLKIYVKDCNITSLKTKI